MKEADKHPNDTYGDLNAKGPGEPAIPAATVVLLRATDATGIETLMLKKNSKLAFGGMWVFPGGRVDPEDRQPGEDDEMAARRAAAREAEEESGLLTSPESFAWFSHWMPPPSAPKRFETWFFAAAAEDGAVRIDHGEIHDHAWLTPAAALDQHRDGAIDLAPPTWVTLYQLSRFATVEEAIHTLANLQPRYYATRVALRQDGVRVAIWDGDTGYEAGDADAPAPHHRLVMQRTGFEFLHPEGWY